MSAYLKTLTALSKPILMRLPPELSHDLAIMSLKYMPLPEPKRDHSRLQTTCFEKIFSNPIGLAAGFDKDGEIVNAARKLGFGFIEVGSVTPSPQVGNKPRLWRVPELESIVNHMGMNSAGHERVLQNLYDSHQMDSIPIGVSLGFNSDSEDIVKDFVRGYNLFTFEADYIVLNISCPNIHHQINHGSHHLQRILETLPLGPPVLIKISPDIDLHELDRIVDLAKEFEVDGMIVSNTHRLESSPRSGGWSGKSIFRQSTKMLAETYIRVENEFPIIGVGGVMSAEDAWTKLEAGASLVQVLTGFVYHGLDFANEIKEGIVERLIRERKALCSVIGSRAKELRYDSGYLKGTP